jgi:hypothetical protein
MGACSLKPPSNSITLQIDTEALRQKHLAPRASGGGAGKGGAALQQSTGTVQFSDFTCLMVNVVGPTIPTQPAPASYCEDYSPKAFPANPILLPLSQTTGTLKVDLVLPIGGVVKLLLWGLITDTPGVCPTVGGLDDPNSSVRVEGVFELAREDVTLVPGVNAKTITLSTGSSTLGDVPVFCDDGSSGGGSGPGQQSPFYFSQSPSPAGSAIPQHFQVNASDPFPDLYLHSVESVEPGSVSVSFDQSGLSYGATSAGAQPTLNFTSALSPGQGKFTTVTVNYRRPGETVQQTTQFSMVLARELAPVTALTATAVSTTSARLDWTAPSSTQAGSQIQVQRYPIGSGAGSIATLANTVTSFTDSTLTAGQGYSYEVLHCYNLSAPGEPISICSWASTTVNGGGGGGGGGGLVYSAPTMGLGNTFMQFKPNLSPGMTFSSEPLIEVLFSPSTGGLASTPASYRLVGYHTVSPNGAQAAHCSSAAECSNLSLTPPLNSSSLASNGNLILTVGYNTPSLLHKVSVEALASGGASLGVVELKFAVLDPVYPYRYEIQGAGLTGEVAPRPEVGFGAGATCTENESDPAVFLSPATGGDPCRFTFPRDGLGRYFYNVVFTNLSFFGGQFAVPSLSQSVEVGVGSANPCSTAVAPALCRFWSPSVGVLFNDQNQPSEFASLNDLIVGGSNGGPSFQLNLDLKDSVQELGSVTLQPGARLSVSRNPWASSATTELRIRDLFLLETTSPSQEARMSVYPGVRLVSRGNMTVSTYSRLVIEGGAVLRSEPSTTVAPIPPRTLSFGSASGVNPDGGMRGDGMFEIHPGYSASVPVSGPVSLSGNLAAHVKIADAPVTISGVTRVAFLKEAVLSSGNIVPQLEVMGAAASLVLEHLLVAPGTVYVHGDASLISQVATGRLVALGNFGREGTYWNNFLANQPDLPLFRLMGSGRALSAGFLDVATKSFEIYAATGTTNFAAAHITRLHDRVLGLSYSGTPASAGLAALDMARSSPLQCTLLGAVNQGPFNMGFSGTMAGETYTTGSPITYSPGTGATYSSVFSQELCAAAGGMWDGTAAICNGSDKQRKDWCTLTEGSSPSGAVAGTWNGDTFTGSCICNTPYTFDGAYCRSGQ